MTEIETATQKAAKIRADIKAAQKAGELGSLPDGLKISVRTEYASLMTAINVIVKNAPAAWHDVPRPADYPAECRELGASLMEIIGRHYNADGRHSFAEVRFDGGRTIAFA